MESLEGTVFINLLVEPVRFGPLRYQVGGDPQGPLVGRGEPEKTRIGSDGREERPCRFHGDTPPRRDEKVIDHQTDRGSPVVHPVKGTEPGIVPVVIDIKDDSPVPRGWKPPERPIGVARVRHDHGQVL